MTDRPAATPPTAAETPGLRQLLALVREDYGANLREWRYPGFQALLAHRLAGFCRQLRPPALRRPVAGLQRRLRRRAVLRYGIDLSDTAVIGRRVHIAHQNGIVVHGGVVVGDDCLLRQGAHLGSRSTVDRRGPVLGKEVRLGVNVVVPGDTVIGDGARLGPNGVVTTDLPAGASTMPARNRTLGR